MEILHLGENPKCFNDIGIFYDSYLSPKVAETTTGAPFIHPAFVSYGDVIWIVRCLPVL